MKTLLAALGVCLVLSASAGTGGKQFLNRPLPFAATNARPIGRLPGARRLNLAISLPLRNQQALAELLQQLYDPASPQYHQFLTPAQFTERFGPAESDFQALVAFAQTNGLQITARHPNRVVLDVSATVADLERVFHIKLQEYAHPRENRTFYAPDTEPSLDFAVPVLNISGLDNYALPHPRSVRRASQALAAAAPRIGSGPGRTYLGSDFRAAYCPGVALDGSGQSVGLLQFDGYYPDDIVAYETLAGLPNVRLVNVPVDGGVDTPGDGNIEVCLDIEMVLSMAPGLSTVYVYEAPNGSPWVDILSRMASDNLAKQLSCSWGGGLPDPGAEQIFQQMALQGQTFLNASGDSDAFTGSIEFPADSPHITQVGGTTLTTGSGGSYLSETVWNWGFYGGSYVGSSGGISDYYPLPAWQQGISMTGNGGSTAFRNVPDVALTADNVYVKSDNGGGGSVGGTSCAAPLWAGFIALVNQQAAANGAPAVGFLNPALYALGQSTNYAACFHDITTGNNTSASSPTQFYAAAGYDLCTGWGTPKGQALLNALAPNQPVLQPVSAAVLAESCVPTNGVLDAGETVTVNFGLQNVGSLSTTNLVATLQASGGVLGPSGPQAYGALAKPGPVVSRPFTFTANATCGQTVTATLQLQDGPVNLGTIRYSLPVGRAMLALSQNFDDVTAPDLPAGWTTSFSDSGANWVTSTAFPDTAPNAAFGAEPDLPGVGELVSPAFFLPAPGAQLTFRHSYNFEADPDDATKAYDGGVLEMKIGSGPFTDILAAGGSFVTGGYTRTIDVSDDNPLDGRQVWSGFSGGFTTTTVNLPAAAANQTVQFKWRLATDTANGYGGTGWNVDTVAVITGYACCTGITPPLITPSSLSGSPTNVVFALPSVSGVHYTLQYKHSLQDPTWLPLLPPVLGTGGTITLHDTNGAAASNRFYRVLCY